VTLEEALFGHLSAYPNLAALVGSRIHPQVLPQKVDYPAVTYFRVGGREEYTQSGTVRVRPRVQLSCWARTYQEAKAVAGQVKAALRMFSGDLGGAGGVAVVGTWVESEIDVYEPDVKVHQVAVSVRFYHE